MRKSLLAAGLVAALAAPALANDSTAELAAGGLVLTTTDAIEMRSEDLFVSADRVQVKYVFVNTTSAAVTTRVAFPMPDIGDADFHFHDTAIPNRDDPANFLDFRTTVDGRPVAAMVEQRAFAGGEDVTHWLRQRGVPLAPYAEGVVGRLDTLSKADQAEALRMGVAVPDEYDAGQGWERHLSPAWTLKTTFHWRQTFPPGAPVTVEHRYRPAVGGSVGSMVGSPRFAADPAGRELQRRYCIDEPFLAAVRKASKGAEHPPFTESRIAYILRTGGNWAKPIGSFRLVVDKGSPKNLVSFCASGVRKIGPTRFEVRKTNWRPDADLWILILKPLPAGG
ncbi:MAG: DUF4424 domain-containing protein [Pseudomonadota bacterium]